jgi:hypothetical protein
MTVFLVCNKGSDTGSFPVVFPCIYMHYKPNWFISSTFLHSTLVPFLWWFQLL